MAVIGSGFCRVSRIQPGIKTTSDRIGSADPILYHNERPTGADVFRRSSAVSKVPNVRIQFSQPGFGLINREVYGT